MFQKKNLFLKNIYPDKDLKNAENKSDLKKCYIAFDYFLHTVVLLNNYHNKSSNIEDVDHGVIETFLDSTLNLKYNSFLELYHEIEEFNVKSADLGRKKTIRIKISIKLLVLSIQIS